MNQVEQDFVEFVAARNGETADDARRRYLAAKAYVDFGSKEYSHVEEGNYETLQVFFNDESEKSLFASYRHYAYSDLLRMLSYTFPKPSTRGGYVRTFLRALRRGDFKKIFSYVRRTAAPRGGGREPSKVERILEGQAGATILDYGCGIGLLSFELAQKSPASKVILADLDTLKLDFAEYRFKKHDIACEVLRIQEGNPYPALPPHTICIATDVFEHLRQPLLAYGHIRDSMEPGGILYGNFEDHKHEMYHVHPDMLDVREAVAKEYDEIGEGLYRKR